ncbi:MFS transporter [Agrobacterium sp. MOPV5]|uniref:MFS transporter n=1 Tax=Agrobacterium leguminum TaxID=2792015 RepID=UPI0018C2097E|nr:MFS transporter [Agrobacterium leguminum]MBG0512100.1 MFS transporter [Agrobacterium leguminum]
MLQNRSATTVQDASPHSPHDDRRVACSDGSDTHWIMPGSQDYQRAGLSLFLVGFATFSLIYCVQPLLPVFSEAFDRSPAESSLALSLTTGLLAIAVVLAGAFSQALGRRGVMFASMALAAVCNIAVGLAPNWATILTARAIEGLVLGGVPAVAMAWLAEEIDPRHLGRAMGLYVAGTAFGGMAGRVGIGLVMEYTSWRAAMVGLGTLGLVACLGFLLLLPTSRNFVRRPGLNLRYHLRAWATSLCSLALLRLYLIGFVLMSIFIALFNYASFRLAIAPFSLSHSTISLIFLVYSLGIVSSSISGYLADQFGRRRLMAFGLSMMLAGVLVTLSTSLPVIILGIALVTAGFFIGHSVASGSVGRLAGPHKGHASSLYLLFYYLGSSAIGSIAGWSWQHGGWMSVVMLTSGLAVVGLMLVLFSPHSPDGSN